MPGWVWESVRTDPTPAVALLNEALQRAVRMTLGFGTGGLTLNEVFHETRKLLRREGTELVLLFEDLALFGLVDDDLYDQFSQQPLDDYCPLRVVFAITTAKIPRNARHRAGPGHASLRRPEHAGRGRRRRPRPGGVRRPVPQQRPRWAGRPDGGASCRGRAHQGERHVGTQCMRDPRATASRVSHRDECFDAFGSVDTGPGGQVGLYPHNVVSLRRAFRHLRDENRLSPRSLVNEVVQTS